ncbi:hypothetical protein PENARI_c037G07030 [Penicillium arizonense]|uniref:Mitochondrial thiamine pyrophosphate carrier 1 n=1 Tax=Penicillium arizonense TaxID=1835702 RepID=A0A1F5L4A5_PENAI|nr:hypothetical protein PENARI_c037G07030 [Penicillium arizonense]OGE47800.1 hypothetical protein PENARI_c037G07030 [Penicillium arizonense]
MHLLPLLTLWLSISNPAQSVEPSAIPGSGFSANGTSTTTTTTLSSPADLTLHHAIASKLASGPARGVRKMSADEGEKFFFEDWYFGDESRDSSSELSERDLYHRIWNGTGSSSGNFVTESKPEDEDEDGDGDGYQYDYSPAQFIAQSFPFEPSFPPFSGSTLVSASDSASDSASEALSRLEARDFKCPTGAYITVITVTVHSTVMVSTVTYSTSPEPGTETSSTSSPTSPSTSTSKSSQTTATETTDSLAPPARPTSLSTATSAATGDDICPTGFYACSAVYHGGCCRTGRNCDTTSCPTTSSTTMTSNGVTIVVPVTTATENSGGSGSGNRCANGWFSCADTVSEPPPIMSDAPQKPLPFVYQFAAGAVAGVSEVPIGRGQDSNTKAAVAGAEHYNGMFDCFRKIVKHEGASRLYRGISAPILMEAPKRATKFAANDSWGSFYRGLFGVEKQTQGLATLTGATAGATEAFVVVPFELVKIRLQDKAQAHKYNGMFDVVKKIVAQEGPLALYNGLESTMWRHILWNAGYFGCIFQVRAQLPAAEPGNKSQQTRNDLIAGTIGGITGTILNTPMDVVKSRIQNTSKVAGQTPKYNWAWPAIGTVMKEEGFSALYKGFTPKVLRLGPGGGILLVVFTGVMDFFRGMRGE